MGLTEAERKKKVRAENRSDSKYRAGMYIFFCVSLRITITLHLCI